MRESVGLCLRTYVFRVTACLIIGSALVIISAHHISRPGIALVRKSQPPPLIRGRAHIVDGDTIDVAGHRIRLEGIDAPESGQWCPKRHLGTWPCGKAATRKLKELIADRPVTCDDVGRGKHGRVIGICRIDGQDINALMVRSGYAWAFVKYSHSYVSEESKARMSRIGIWSGAPAIPAWQYRERGWTVAEQKSPDGCPIKGNTSSNGRIYHMPWSPWYKKVRIDKARGDRWFCSESEAKAAGWRPVQEF